ncbi:hypothetical protein SASC598J21_007440 [Snodgrassella alvi SCGC AB-598-J21]|uniref:Uncharacterized protein n=1 Tax=Snodgrassella alvi SCGC AB-598-J21 TaxID=1385367 RepID=A0A074VG93_9NEIS|nr:hypothetical protein SASC598J21_007440 [Snodgrassella alvi SCGC AB-598-J21]
MNNIFVLCMKNAEYLHMQLTLQCNSNNWGLSSKQKVKINNVSIDSLIYQP